MDFHFLPSVSYIASIFLVRTEYFDVFQCLLIAMYVLLLVYRVYKFLSCIIFTLSYDLTVPTMGLLKQRQIFGVAQYAPY